MVRALPIVAALTAALPGGRAQHGLEPDQAQLLDGARAYALHYSASLPNFLCTQVVRRSEDEFGAGRWRQLDTLLIKVSYSGQEEYQLMQHNGVATDLDYRSVGGAISSGEFGTRLIDIFAPHSAAEFAWKGWSQVRRRRVAVFKYRVAQEHSRNQVSYGAGSSSAKTVVTGYHGEVSVDPESSAVLRVTLTGDLPRDFAITACSSWTEYDYRDVAGRNFLLPVESETRLESNRYRASNHIEFREYRKFQSEATITFK